MTATGGTSATSAADEFTYTSGPSVSGITPVAGPLAGGTSVTITGANFNGATAVSFGTTAATSYTVNSATSITATSPAGTGTVNITVTTPGGTSATSAADQFTYERCPDRDRRQPDQRPGLRRDHRGGHRHQLHRRHRRHLRRHGGDHLHRQLAHLDHRHRPGRQPAPSTSR